VPRERRLDSHDVNLPEAMSTTHVTCDITRLADFVGREAASGWIDVPDDVISGFADITGDRQWIHVDAERARTESPYGATIAHGFLTLSLVSRLLRDAVSFEKGPRLAINYGLNRVRFPAPLPAGSKVRGRFTLVAVEPAGDAWQATWSAIIEREGSDKPCCVADWLVRYYR
jgi:acyl dehydratase